MHQKHEQAFRDLLVVDVVRGPDSTGIMGASSQDGVQLVKKALLPNELFTMKATQELFQSYNYILMGHNRWATQGAINGINAHPFQFETLVGTHNGTLVNQTLLPDSEKFEVDSENVFHSIQEIGVAKTYKLLHGAASLVWFEEEKRNLHFLRNKERPMFITYTKDRKTLFWASEAWMLEGVLWKNNIEFTDIFNTVEDTHYQFRIPHYSDEKKEGETYLAFPKVNIKKLEAYVPPPKSTTVVQGHFTGNTTTSGAISTAKRAGGYEIGEEVYFFLNPRESKGHRYIDCINSKDFSKIVRVYCKKSSWLRKNAELHDTTLYLGKVNGYIFGENYNGVVLQENSVFTVDQTEEDNPVNIAFDEDGDIDWNDMSDEEILPFSFEAFSLKDREHQHRVLLRCNHTCGICSETVTPNPGNFCLSDNDIICHRCRDTEFAKELIAGY